MLSRGCECVWAPIAIPPLIISRASSQLRKRRSSAGPTEQAHKQRSLGELRSRTSDSKVQTVFRKASRQKPVRTEPDKPPDRNSTCAEPSNRTFSGGQRPRNRRPQSENGVHQEESAKVRGWGASLSDNAVYRRSEEHT